MDRGRISLEYFVHEDEIWVELWLGKAHEAMTLDDFYKEDMGRTLIDADISAYRQSGRCQCGRDLDSDFADPLAWFKCVIRNNFAEYDGVADSTHLGAFVTHIPESQCKECKNPR